MLWGRRGPRQINVGPEPQLLEFEFSPTEDEPARATMHLRFGQSAGTVCLDDIEVVDLHDGTSVIPKSGFENGVESFRRDWTFWPPGEANTVGAVSVTPACGRDGSAGLRIELKAPADGDWPDFHIHHHPNLALRRGHRYRVRLWVRALPARKLTVAFYRPGQTFTFLGGPPSPLVAQIRMAADVGIDLVSFPVPLPWPRPGQAVSWADADARCRQVLDANPKALLLPRIGTSAPRWWREAHPGDVMMWDRGPPKRVVATVASERYRRKAAERLTALVEHLEDAFGPHVAGYHPCGQNTGEWFYQDTWGPALNGYSEASKGAWRQWLRKRYENVSALRAAWRNAHVTFDTAEVPSPASRRSAPAGVLRNPVAERSLIDLADFQQEMMANCVLELARTVRNATHGKKLVVFFYGYVFEFGAIHNGPATSGHYGLRRVLDSPDIDILCSPISYWDRALGGGGHAMTAAESVALAGKMWLYEDDTATHLSSGTFPGRSDKVATLGQSNALLLRNTAQCALRNFGTWWMDLGATGWFEDARIWEQMRRLAPLDRAQIEKPRAFRPEVAAVVDETSMLRVAHGGNIVTRPLVYEARQALGRMGAPYGQYLLDDVVAGRLGARLYVFLNAWCLTHAQRKQLSEATRGAFKVWCYAPGYQEVDGVNRHGMRALTGFRLAGVRPAEARAVPTAAGKRQGLTRDLGVKQQVAPLFAVVDATPEETLAVYSDGSAAVVLRRTDDGGSLFVGPPGLTSELLRLAARRAGVHQFTRPDCNVYANGPFAVLHAARDGPLDVHFGSRGPITDFLSGKLLGRGPRITLPIRRGETRVLQFEEDDEHADLD